MVAALICPISMLIRHPHGIAKGLWFLFMIAHVWILLLSVLVGPNDLRDACAMSEATHPPANNSVSAESSTHST
jgi:hypothetical protein